FITPLNFWRPDMVRRMRAHIEEQNGQDWMVTVARAPTFCEPVTYGCLVLANGPETCGHRLIDAPLCHSYWTPRPISAEEMGAFLAEVPETAYAVNIQSKAEMPIETYDFMVRGRPAPVDAAS
ncbi:MAG: hypothetical protein MI723_05365, partial [Caulobacterales bacterium]|nr:hypothetical protein [Caulobacterales bacterium]